MALTVEYDGLFDDIVSVLPEVTKTYFGYKTKTAETTRKIREIEAERARRAAEEASALARMNSLQRVQYQMKKIKIPWIPIVIVGSGLVTMMVIMMMRRNR